ncbi:MAG: stage III sporulation protein D [Clostridiales bacterium]|nr:stage III sporulation protein D [Clostridiales bacterium]
MTNYETDERTLRLAYYILDKKTTIRATAKAFNIPKSTVHHDLSTKLKYINYPLYKAIKRLLDENFSIKHIHGGESTKLKYEKLKSEINKNDIYEVNNF